MILVVFHTAGINEKKKEKKKILYRTWMGYCPIELRACAAGRWGAGARRRGRWGAGLGAGRWARGRAGAGLGVQARRQRALGAHWARSRRRRGRRRACRVLGAGARGWRADRRRRARTGAGVRGRARTGVDGRGRARQGARGRAVGMQAGRGRRAGHGRPGRGLGAACARGLGQLGQVGVLCTLTRFFWPGSTR